jgi:hypothetical protein
MQDRSEIAVVRKKSHLIATNNIILFHMKK